MLTRAEIRLIAEEVVSLLERHQAQESQELWTTAQAARYLGVSQCTLRRNKDMYRYVKRGEGKQGRLMFLADALRKSALGRIRTTR